MYNMSMNDRQIAQLEIVKTKVRQLLGGDTSGHADDHVERVALLAERFANEYSESVNLQEVLLTAWLHDVDDYKLVGKTQAEKLTNAVDIMAQAEIADDLSQVVLENIAAIGYSKRLNGKQPQRLAGKLTSLLETFSRAKRFHDELSELKSILLFLQSRQNHTCQNR